jgi:hypothetical protein
VTELAVVTAIDCIVLETASSVETETEPTVAFIVVLPRATPITTPLDEIVAIAVLELLQVTVLAGITADVPSE